MKKLIIATLCLALLASAAMAQQIPPPKSASEVPGPASGTIMTKAYAQMIGRMAYLWGYAMVNMYNRRAAFAFVTAQHGNVPGFNGGVVPMAPVGQIAMLTDYLSPQQTFIACPNQDVVYGVGFFALDKDPVVFQVPDFGTRFWIYAVYDARTDQIAQIGKPYGTKPGFYLIVGPNWKGKTPAGITAVIRSSTELGFAIPRIFKDDTAQDTKAIQPLLSQIVFYPLRRFDGKMKTMDWSRLPALSGAGGSQDPDHLGAARAVLRASFRRDAARAAAAWGGVPLPLDRVGLAGGHQGPGAKKGADRFLRGGGAGVGPSAVPVAARWPSHW